MFTLQKCVCDSPMEYFVSVYLIFVKINMTRIKENVQEDMACKFVTHVTKSCSSHPIILSFVITDSQCVESCFQLYPVTQLFFQETCPIFGQLRDLLKV